MSYSLSYKYLIVLTPIIYTNLSYKVVNTYVLLLYLHSFIKDLLELTINVMRKAKIKRIKEIKEKIALPLGRT